MTAEMHILHLRITNQLSEWAKKHDFGQIPTDLSNLRLVSHDGCETLGWGSFEAVRESLEVAIAKILQDMALLRIKEGLKSPCLIRFSVESKCDPVPLVCWVRAYQYAERS